MGTAHLTLSSLSLHFLLFGSVMIWVCAWVQSESRHYREKQLNKRKYSEKRSYFADWMTKSSPNTWTLTVCLAKVHEWTKLDVFPWIETDIVIVSNICGIPEASLTADGSVINTSHLSYHLIIMVSLLFCNPTVVGSIPFDVNVFAMFLCMLWLVR